MLLLEPLDFGVLFVVITLTLIFYTKGKLWGISKVARFEDSPISDNDDEDDSDRNIVAVMDKGNKNCVVFFGSETGTAEGYAKKLAKEAVSRFGLRCMVADIQEYDMKHLGSMSNDTVAMFVLATAGEGDPTDNATAFWEFIGSENPSFTGKAPSHQALQHLRYTAFGLGNKSYENFNAVVKVIDTRLKQFGAKRIGYVGLGDDCDGTTEEDFLAWKSTMWVELSKEMGLEEKTVIYQPSFKLSEGIEVGPGSKTVYQGQFTRAGLLGKALAPFSAANPFVASISESRELFVQSSRNCLHLEISLEGSNLKYETGDHVGVLAINQDQEVDRFLHVFGVAQSRHRSLDIKAFNRSTKSPIPNPSTYDAIARYYLEICAPASRQLISQLAPFAPNTSSREEIARLGSSGDYFHQRVTSRLLNLAQTLEMVSGGEVWSSVPFSLLVEELSKLKPRFYSISSSPLASKSTLSITAVVESLTSADGTNTLKGVATNHLLRLHQKLAGPAERLVSAVDAPWDRRTSTKIPIFIRPSRFRLPKNASLPVIMVGPGTGVAPFRGFIQERVSQAKKGVKIGPTWLFCGSRSEREDFLYADEWKQCKEILGSSFEIVTAFSREGLSKVYVQHRLLERAAQVNSLLMQKANFYVCGDAANMAKEVNRSLCRIIAENQNTTQSAAEDVVKKMRTAGQYQEDVW